MLWAIQNQLLFLRALLGKQVPQHDVKRLHVWAYYTDDICLVHRVSSTPHQRQHLQVEGVRRGSELVVTHNNDSDLYGGAGGEVNAFF
jgi:hypothetical protein